MTSADPTATGTATDRRRRGIRAVVGASGVALFGALAWYGGADMLTALSATSLPLLAWALGLSALLYPIAAWRWALVTNSLAGRQVATYRAFLRVRVLAAAGGFFAPREVVELGGRVLWLIHGRGEPAGRAAKGVLLDRFCDITVSLAALSGPLGLWLLNLSSLQAATAMIFACGGVVLVLPRVFIGISALAREKNHRLAGNETEPAWKRRLVQRLAALVDVEGSIWRMALLLSVLKFVVVSARVVLLASAVALGAEAALVITMVPLGQLGYLLAITPGGIGIYETGWFGILSAIGGETAQITAFVVLLRICLIGSVVCMAPVALLRHDVPENESRGPGAKRCVQGGVPDGSGEGG